MTNNFFKPIIKTEDLKITDIPEKIRNWQKFTGFALTFDPSREDLTEDDLMEIKKNTPSRHQNAKVLRATLYNWQRIWNNTTESPPNDFFPIAEKISKWIAEKL